MQKIFTGFFSEILINIAFLISILYIMSLFCWVIRYTAQKILNLCNLSKISYYLNKVSNVYHEGAHTIFSFIFRNEVLYVNVSTDPKVIHSYNKYNFMQNAGVFFISFAPLIVSIIWIYVLNLFKVPLYISSVLIYFMLFSSAPSKEDYKHTLVKFPYAVFFLFILLIVIKIIMFIIK